MTRETKIKAEEKIPITGQGYTLGKLLDGTDCQILLDTGAQASYICQKHITWGVKVYMHYPNLLPMHIESKSEMDNM